MEWHECCGVNVHDAFCWWLIDWHGWYLIIYFPFLILFYSTIILLILIFSYSLILLLFLFLSFCYCLWLVEDCVTAIDEIIKNGNSQGEVDANLQYQIESNEIFALICFYYIILNSIYFVVLLLCFPFIVFKISCSVCSPSLIVKCKY